MNTESREFLLGYELGKQAQVAFAARPRKQTAYDISRRKADKIIGVCCGYFNITTHTLTKKNRDEKTLYPRQITQYFLRLLSGLPLKDIGKDFNQDHATVIHSYSVIDDQFTSGSETVVYDVRVLTELINEAFETE